ncbi:MAG: GCN5-related N-acetyltransferase [Paenibacillus sp.]|nr:GCN5-related N-acetyltransferase [Paenibacillus sp.]
MPKCEIVPLTSELLAEGGLLLANYIDPQSGAAPEAQQRCIHILQNLLQSPYASFYMAKAEESFAGFMALNWGFSTTKGQPFVIVQDLFVLEAYRKRGIAKSLIRHAVHIARQHQANRVQLNTATGNEAARRLYEQLGFEWFPHKEIYMYFVK